MCWECGAIDFNRFRNGPSVCVARLRMCRCLEDVVCERVGMGGRRKRVSIVMSFGKLRWAFSFFAPVDEGKENNGGDRETTACLRTHCFTDIAMRFSLIPTYPPRKFGSCGGELPETYQCCCTGRHGVGCLGNRLVNRVPSRAFTTRFGDDLLGRITKSRVYRGSKNPVNSQKTR